MSAEYDDKARALASRITQRLSADIAAPGEVAELRAGLGDAVRRLSNLEARIQDPRPKAKDPRPSAHPSQERFSLEPVIAEMVDYLEGGKRCAFEPGNKPCDNCAMCTARGF